MSGSAIPNLFAVIAWITFFFVTTVDLGKLIVL